MPGLLDIETTARCLRESDPATRASLERALEGRPIDTAAARHLIGLPPDKLAPLLAVAGHVRTRTKGRTITYSPNVFLPVTNLCSDCCSYCTFREPPGSPRAWTMLPEEVRFVARAGRAARCTEALLCLGDHPERVVDSYRRTLAVLGCTSTVDYLEQCCAIALDEGLLPHTNAGVLTKDEMRRLQPLNASMGLMIETASARLCERGAPHAKSPDKHPERRLQMLREAGELGIPFTTGLLVGIGETPEERVVTLEAIGELHKRFGHVQEIIVQNFRAKPGTAMAAQAEPAAHEIAATVAVARLMFPDMNLQVPPNLNPSDLRLLLAAGINDWGGVSPLTGDFVNPEAPWPHLSVLTDACRAEGFDLEARLPLYPEFAARPQFVHPSMREHLRMVTAASEAGRDG